jgi:Protein of unknown function (DUF3168)
LTTVESLVRSALLDDPAVNAAVGGSRIYPLTRPQESALPAITFQRVSSPRVDSLSGTAYLANARLQLDAWAANYQGAKDLGIYMRRALNGYVRRQGPRPRLRSIVALADNTDEEGEAPSNVYRERRDYSIWWEED